MDRKIRYFVNGWGFRLSFATRPGYDGDHEDISDGDSYELGEYENSEEALAAAEAFISTHGNEVNDEEDGIGSVIYWTVEVERRVEYKENEWLPCDESGRLMMVTAMSRMRPSHISAHWKEAARSGRSSLRRTSIWHGWNTRQTVIRRSTATWIR